MSRLGMTKPSMLLVLLTVLVAGGVRSASAEDSEELAGYLPESSNAIAVVRLGDVMKTPRARREDWANNDDANLLSGSGRIPSWIETLMVGFLVRPAVPEEVWASGVVSVPDSITIEQLASREGSRVEQLGEFPVVRGRRDAYIMPLKPGRLAVRRPAIRQEAAQWMAAIQAGHSGLNSDYLQQAASNSAHLVLAIDLAHTLDPAQMREHLKADDRLREHPDELERVAELLRGIRGATFAARIGDGVFRADLRFDFTDPVGNLGLRVRNFFLDVLNELGAEIEELAQSDARTLERAVVLNTTLSDDSLRRVLSLITMSAAHSAVAPPAPAPDPTQATPATTGINVESSRRYLQAVNRILDDLDRANRRATNYARTATWHENFARNIDDLPINGVDPELVDFGSVTSSRLRGLARSLRGQAVEVNIQQGTLTYDVEFTPGWASVNVWGGLGWGQPAYNVRSNLQDVRQRQAEAVLAGVQQRTQIWEMIADDRAAIQRRMSEKHGDAFVR